jgi:hypothetical protein
LQLFSERPQTDTIAAAKRAYPRSGQAEGVTHLPEPFLAIYIQNPTLLLITPLYGRSCELGELILPLMMWFVKEWGNIARNATITSRYVTEAKTIIETIQAKNGWLFLHSRATHVVRSNTW